MDADPIFVGEGDIDAARALVELAPDAELFLYPGDQHYVADSSLPSYAPSAARYSGNVYWSSSRPADRGRGMGVEFAPWPAHIAHRRGRSPSSASRARTARDPSGVAS